VRWDELLPVTGADARFEFVNAEGGRLCESSRCRGDTVDVFGEFVGRPFITGALCAGALGAAMR
jgi:hypothetical protein